MNVTSKDGTQIGYRASGHGPGVVLVQGALGTAYHYDQLARALSDDFTVYVPDRRGRGSSPSAYRSQHSIRRDVEDLESLLNQGDAQFVFGLSSGAVITLEAARTLPQIRKVALYEPPFSVNTLPSDLIMRFDDQLHRGKLAAALVTAMHIVKLTPPALAWIPDALFELAFKGLLYKEKKLGSGPYSPLRELIPAMRFDFRVVSEMADTFESFTSVRAEVLLLGGTKSPAYLKAALATLARILPSARRLELDGLDHSAPWNVDRGGQPRLVARALRNFFLEGPSSTIKGASLGT